MRPKGSKSELESRRFQAYFLYCQGKPVHEIASALGAAPRAVKLWVLAGKKKGLAGLTSVPHRGNPKAWTEESLNQLKSDLQFCPIHFGFPEERWNGALVAQHIEKRFGIRYHKKYIQEFLRTHSLSDLISVKARKVSL